MPLSADQRAMLELLLERGQSYGDLASLLDLPESEVRDRARAALAELGGADPDRNVGLTDYLLGQADPIGRADAARHLKEDPDDHALAAKLAASLQLLAPGAELPKLPAEPGGGRFMRRAPADDQAAEAPAPAQPREPGRAAGRLSGLSSSHPRMLIGGALAGVILVVAVLAIAGVFGGDGGSGATASDDSASTAAPSGDEDTASIPLRSVGGGDASGEVTIGLTTGEQGYIDVSVDRLEPPPNGQTYFVWFMQDRTRGYPYQPLRVQGNQGATARYALPNEVLGIIFSARSLDIWLAPTAELRQEIRGALQNAELVDVPGERILTAPLAGALDAAQGAGGSGDDSAG